MPEHGDDREQQRREGGNGQQDAFGVAFAAGHEDHAGDEAVKEQK